MITRQNQNESAVDHDPVMSVALSMSWLLQEHRMLGLIPVSLPSTVLVLLKERNFCPFPHASLGEAYEQGLIDDKIDPVSGFA
jgi:hypothetical protein